MAKAKLSPQNLRRQAVEALWALGYDEATLRAIDINNPASWTGGRNVNTSDENDKFFAHLGTIGINSEHVTTAIRMAEWRPNKKDPFDKQVADYLKNVMGWEDTSVIHRRAVELANQDRAKGTGTIGPAQKLNYWTGGKEGPSYQEGHIMRALNEVLGPQAFTQTAIKLQAPHWLRPDLRGNAPEWNPLRGDNPNAKPAAPAPAPAPAPPPNQATPPPPSKQPPAQPVGTTVTSGTGGAGAGAGSGSGGGGGGGGGGASTGGQVTEPFPTDPARVKDYIRKNYPRFAYLLDIPEVYGVITDAAKRGLGDEELMGKIQGTQWWNKTEPAARYWKQFTSEAGDAAVEEVVGSRMRDFGSRAKAAGITIGDDDLRELATDSLQFGWDEFETEAALGRFFTWNADSLTGQAAVDTTALRAMADSYAVPISDATLGSWVTQIVSGEVEDTDYFKSFLAGQAKSLFPALADHIDRGLTVKDIANPYVELAARNLELNPADINLADGKWLRPLQAKDDKGQPSLMSLSDWQDTIRTDSTYGWDNTSQAKEHAASLAKSLAETFGRA